MSSPVGDGVPEAEADRPRRPPLVVIQSYPVWLPQTQRWMYNNVRYLPTDLIESHVVCDRTENLDQFDVSNIHCIYDESKAAYFWSSGLRKLRLRRRAGYPVRVAGDISAEILHSHFGPIGWADLRIARRAGLRHVVTFYGFDVNRLPTVRPQWKRRYRELFVQAEVFLCEGPHMADQLVALGCPEEKIEVLHLGVEIDSIPYRPRRWRQNEPLRVLIASSFREKKGIPHALEALAAVRREVDVEITIIGDATAATTDRAEKRRILQTIEETDLRSATRLLGFQPHSRLMKEAYRHHIYISPSITASDGDTEGGAPVAIIEMMASGMPIVSTDHCDIPEVVTYGGAEWLAPESSPLALADRLRWLVDNHEGWALILDEGRQRAVAEFDARVQTDKLAALYRSLVPRVS